MSKLVSQLPPLAVYPPSAIRASLSAEDWQACLDAWTLNLKYRLQLDDQDFTSTASTALEFLSSYLRTYSDSTLAIPASEQGLRKVTFVFSCRVFESISKQQTDATGVPIDVFTLLAQFCGTFKRLAALKPALQKIWEHVSSIITAGAEAAKARQLKLIATGNDKSFDELVATMHCTSCLVQELPNVGSTFMSGDDYLEAISLMYSRSIQKGSDVGQRVASELLHVCLWSLTQSNPIMTSLLLDQLYTLRSLAMNGPSGGKPNDQIGQQPTILSSLICSTSFLQRLKALFSNPAVSNYARAESTIASLDTYHQKMAHLHSPPRRRVQNPSKGKGRDHNVTNADHEMHIHAMTQVSTLQELFPHLSPAYLLRLLDHFNNDTESVTAALLEPDSLPAYLANQQVESASPEPQPQPSKSVLPARKNKFDNDDFANLRISESQLHYGKADSGTRIDEVVSERTKHKAAILSALAAFDSDDDERDDTYDVADVGGTVDSVLPGTDDAEAMPSRGTSTSETMETQKADQILYRAWRDDPNSFARDSKMRAESQVRNQLKRDLNEVTGQQWTDEMIEGWAIMVSRDQKRQRDLDRRFGSATAFSGQQAHIQRTSWRQPVDAEGTDDDSHGSDGPSRGGQRGHNGRGRGTWRGRGRGGNTAGSPGEASTQAARRRKEQRGGGNHSRRDGRAKKMGRGFGGQPAT